MIPAVLPATPIPLEFYAPAVEPDRLFVSTIDWLEEIVHGANHLEYLMAAARLRQLLLDGSDTLVHLVNRTHRMRIRFSVVPFPPDLPIKGMTAGLPDGLYPFPEFPASRVREDTLDQFLREQVLLIDDVEVTVRDLILHSANVAGGVHRGKPRDAVQAAVEDLAEKILLDGLPFGVRCLRGVVLVTVAALRPLRDAIADRPTPSPFDPQP